MADALEMVFSLVDKVSEPANKIKESMGGLGESFDKMKGAEDPLAMVSEGLLGIAGVAGIAVAAIGGLAAGLLVAGAHLALDATEAREHIMAGFEYLLGGRAAADDMVGKIEGMSKNMSVGREKALEWGAKMVKAGMNEGDMKNMMAAMSDVVAANGGNEASGDAFLQRMMRMKIANKAPSTRDLMALQQTTGITPDALYASMAKSQGKTVEEVKAALKHDKDAGQHTVDAIMAAMAEKGGGELGGAGKKFADGDITIQINKLKETFTSLFSHVDFSKISTFLSNLNAQFTNGNPAVERFKTAINRLGDVFTSMFGNIDGDKVQKIMDKIADVFETVVGIVIGVVAALKQAWVSLQPHFDKLAASFAKITGPAGKSVDVFGILVWVIEATATQAGYFVDGISLLIDSLMWLPTKIGEAVVAVLKFFGILGDDKGKSSFMTMIDGIIDYVTSFPERVGKFIKDGIDGMVDKFNAGVATLKGVGGAIIDGLWEGIQAGWSRLLKGFELITSALPANIRKILGIASPSKVFMDIGGHVTAGFEKGIEEGGDPAGAMADMMEPPKPSGSLSQSTAAARGGARGGGSPTINLGAINLNAGNETDPKKLADAVAAIVVPQLITALDQMSVEAGSA